VASSRGLPGRPPAAFHSPQMVGLPLGDVSAGPVPPAGRRPLRTSPPLGRFLPLTGLACPCRPRPAAGTLSGPPPSPPPFGGGGPFFFFLLTLMASPHCGHRVAGVGPGGHSARWKILFQGCTWPRAWALLVAGSGSQPGGRPNGPPGGRACWGKAAGQ